MELPIGPDLKQYDYQVKLGAGRFGSVHKYTLRNDFKQNADIPREMAVKKIIGNQEIAEMREIEMCLLIHKNIITFFGVESIEGTVHIKMEAAKCNLKTFHKEIVRGPCDGIVFLHLAIQISEGLKFLHENKIAHRDIRPCNILVLYLEDIQNINDDISCVLVKLCYFGLSRNVPDYVITMTAVGTHAYVAPEVKNALLKNTVFRGDYKKVDIYSCGMVFLELLINRLPEMQELERSINGPIPFLEYFGPIREEFVALLSLMLLNDSNERINAKCLVDMIKPSYMIAINQQLTQQKLRDGSSQEQLRFIGQNQEELAEQQIEIVPKQTPPWVNHHMQKHESKEKLKFIPEEKELWVSFQNRWQLAWQDQLSNNVLKVVLIQEQPGINQNSQVPTLVDNQLTHIENKDSAHSTLICMKLGFWILDSIITILCCGDKTIHLAACCGCADTAQRLIALGTDPDRKGIFDQTPLHDACRYGNLSVILILLSAGADMNARDELGRTPLNSALHVFQWQVAKALVKKGADINLADSAGCTPLHRASKQSDPEIARLLLEHGAAINVVDNKGRTPLHHSCKRGHIAVATLLIANGAKVNARDRNDDTSLHLAFHKDHLEIVKVLLASGVDMNPLNKRGETPLERANDIHWAFWEWFNDLQSSVVANSSTA